MKRKLAVLMALLMLVTLFSSCRRASERLSEKISESIMERQLGDDVDINFKDGTIEYESDDGSKMYLGSGKWPDSKLAKLVPEYDSGDISNVVESDDSLQVTVVDDDRDYMNRYLEKVKKDFDKDANETKSGDMLTYQASDKRGNMVYMYIAGTQFVISITRSDD